jgi:hypothetical protein
VASERLNRTQEVGGSNYLAEWASQRLDSGNGPLGHRLWPKGQQSSQEVDRGELRSLSQETNYGSDGTRTRDLRRDSLA